MPKKKPTATEKKPTAEQRKKAALDTFRAINTQRLIQRLGEKKFGPITPWAFAALILDQDPDWLEERCEAILDASSWDDVFPPLK